MIAVPSQSLIILLLAMPLARGNKQAEPQAAAAAAEDIHEAGENS